jgi:CheY-like chemotaxis protein
VTTFGAPDSDERIPAVVPGPREPRPRILLVDDEAINRSTLAAPRPGYETAEAADGLAALRSAAFQPDLVLLDVEMPGLGLRGLPT